MSTPDYLDDGVAVLVTVLAYGALQVHHATERFAVTAVKIGDGILGRGHARTCLTVLKRTVEGAPFNHVNVLSMEAAICSKVYFDPSLR